MDHLDRLHVPQLPPRSHPQGRLPHGWVLSSAILLVDIEYFRFKPGEDLLPSCRWSREHGQGDLQAEHLGPRYVLHQLFLQQCLPSKEGQEVFAWTVSQHETLLLWKIPQKFVELQGKYLSNMCLAKQIPRWAGQWCFGGTVSQCLTSFCCSSMTGWEASMGLNLFSTSTMSSGFLVSTSVN